MDKIDEINKMDEIDADDLFNLLPPDLLLSDFDLLDNQKNLPPFTPLPNPRPLYLPRPQPLPLPLPQIQPLPQPQIQPRPQPYHIHLYVPQFRPIYLHQQSFNQPRFYSIALSNTNNSNVQFCDKSSTFDPDFYNNYKKSERNVILYKKQCLKMSPVFLRDGSTIKVLCFSRTFSLSPGGFFNLKVPILEKHLIFNYMKIELMGNNYKKDDGRWSKLSEHFINIRFLMEKNFQKMKYITMINNEIEYFSIKTMSKSTQPLILFDTTNPIEFKNRYLVLRIMLYYKNNFFKKKLNRNNILYNLRFVLMNESGTNYLKFNMLNILECKSNKNINLINGSRCNIGLFSKNNTLKRRNNYLNTNPKKKRKLKII